MLPGIELCVAGLPPFPTACWWSNHYPVAITGVSVAARGNSPGGCGGPSVLLLCKCRVHDANSLQVCLFVGWLLNVPATCECISGTDLHRQFYVLPH